MGSWILRMTFHWGTMLLLGFTFLLMALEQRHFWVVCAAVQLGSTLMGSSFEQSLGSFRILGLDGDVHPSSYAAGWKEGGDLWGQDASGLRPQAGAFSGPPCLRWGDFVTCVHCPSGDLSFMVSTPVKWLFQLYYCTLHVVSIHFNVLTSFLWLSLQVHCVFQVDARPWFSHFSILNSTCVPA